MQVQRAEWVSHDSFPLYAVDIQPGSLRFATGGADGTARVWSTAALLDPSCELQESLRSPLYTTTSHSAGVRAVRWSTGGRFLATGGDEGTVVVHELKPGPGMRTFGSTRAGGGGAGAGVDAEPWTPVFVIKGHSLEVQDLAWCPCNDLDIETWLNDLTVSSVPARLRKNHHDAATTSSALGVGGQRRGAEGKLGMAVERTARPPMIASCSNDNLVCVWALLDARLSPGRMQQEQEHRLGPALSRGAGAGSSLDMPAKHVPVTGPCTISSPLLTIKTHTSWVQGVAWDPLGHYLTSISDDRSLSVWRTCIPAGSQAAAVLQKEVFEAKPVQRGEAEDDSGEHEDEEEEVEERDAEAMDASYARRIRQLLKQGADGWHEVDFINVPFQECASQGPIRRVDWSCDGAVVAGTHAKVFDTLTLSLMSRPERVPIMHLAGYIRPVVAVRSSSVLCMSAREAERVDGRGPTGASGSAATGAGTSNATTFPLLFAGSNDRSVSVWSPTRCTPLFVLTGGLTSGGPVADFACAPVPQAGTLATLRQRRLDAAVREVQALASEAPNDAVLSRLCSALEGVASLNLAQLYAQCAPRCVTATAGLVTLAVTLDGSAVSVILPSPSPGDAGSASSSPPSSLGICAADARSALAHMSAIYGLDRTAVLAGEGLPAVKGSGKGKAVPGQSRRQSRHKGDARTEGDSGEDDDEAEGEALEQGEGTDETEPAPALAPIEVLAWLQRRQLLYGPLSTSMPVRPVFVPDVPLAVLRVTQPQAARAIQALHAAHVLAAAPPKLNNRATGGPAGESQHSLAGGSLAAEGLAGAGGAGIGSQAGEGGGFGGPVDIERRQVVTLLKDGRRRIQPVLVTMEDDFAAFASATEETAAARAADRALPMYMPNGVDIASKERPEAVLGLLGASEAGGEAVGFGSALAGLLGTVSGRVVQDDPDVSLDIPLAAAAGAGAGPSGGTPDRPSVAGTSSALDVLQARLQASAGRGSSSTASLHSTLPLLRPHPFASSETGGEGAMASRAVTWGRRRLTQAQREQRVQLYANEAQTVARKLERLRTETGQDEGEDEVAAQADVGMGMGMGMGGYGMLAGQQQQPFYAQAHHAGLAIQHKQEVPSAAVSLLPPPPVLPRITTSAAVAPTAGAGGAQGHGQGVVAPLRGSASAQLMSVLDPALAMLQADSGAMDMDWGMDAASAGYSTSSNGGGAPGKGSDIRYFTAYTPAAGPGTGGAPLQLDAVTTSSTAWSRTLASRPTVLLHVPKHNGFPLSLLLIGCADGALHVWDADTGRPALARGMTVMATQGAQPVRDLAYIAREDEESCMRVACLGCDGSLTVWSVVRPPSPHSSSSGTLVQLRMATKTSVAPVLSLVSGMDAPGSVPATGTEAVPAIPTLGGLQLDTRGNVSILAVLPNKPRAQFVWDSAAGSWTR